METFGAVVGILLFIKVGLHIYLLSKTEEDFRLLDYISKYSSRVFYVLLLPSMDNVPKHYRILKVIINVLYTISFVGLIVFLVWYNAFRN
jgi:hypothetical protein